MYHEQIYRLPYFVGKARTTQLGFCPQSIGASKDREQSIGWESMRAKTASAGPTWRPSHLSLRILQ